MTLTKENEPAELCIMLTKYWESFKSTKYTNEIKSKYLSEFKLTETEIIFPQI